MHDGLLVLALVGGLRRGPRGVPLARRARASTDLRARPAARRRGRVAAGVGRVGFAVAAGAVAVTGFALLLAVPLLAPRLEAALGLWSARSRATGRHGRASCSTGSRRRCSPPSGSWADPRSPRRRRCSRWRWETASAGWSAGSGGGTATGCPGRRRRAWRARWWWRCSRRSGRRWRPFCSACRSRWRRVLGAGLAAALAEAVAPRATDNVLVPLAVWLVAGGLESGGAP